MSVELFSITGDRAQEAKKIWGSQHGKVESIGPETTFHYHSLISSFTAKFKLAKHRLSGVFKDSPGKTVELQELGSPETFRAKLIAEGFIEADEATDSYKTLLSYLGVS
jgi:hypothetical protein